ncbi:MAG: LPP20 family lipoprotein [Bacteroidota bacterium]|jgi:shikimate kinase
MRLIISFLIVALSIMLIGCGGPKSLQSTDTGNVPDWFMNVPKDPNFLYGAKTATSQDLQLALDKAATDARAEIARQVEIKVEGLQKRFQEETGTSADAQLLDQFTQANKTVVSTSLSGTQVTKQKQLQDGSLWRAYVLVEYPVGAANQAFLEQMKKNEQLYTRFRATQTFKELEDEVKKLDEAKKAQ